MRQEPDGQNLTLGQRAQLGFVKVKQEARQVKDRNINGSFDRLFGGKQLGDDPQAFYSRKNQDFITFNSEKFEVKKQIPVRLRRTQTTSVKNSTDESGPLTSEPSKVTQLNVDPETKLQENRHPDRMKTAQNEEVHPSAYGEDRNVQSPVDALDNFMHRTRPELRER